MPTNQANATEQSISDKSQTNGTSGAEPSPVPYSLVSKEKEKAEKILPAVVPPTQSPQVGLNISVCRFCSAVEWYQVTQAAQNLVVEPPAVVEKSPEVSAPVNVSKSNTIDAVVAKITQPSSESKVWHKVVQCINLLLHIILKMSGFVNLKENYDIYFFNFWEFLLL